MKEQARVIDCSQDIITVACMDGGSCASCAGKGFCNVQGKQFTAVNSSGLDIAHGDDVEIYLPPGKTMFSGFMVMMLPLITFGAGYLASSRLFAAESELVNALGGFLGLAAGFLIAYGYGRVQKTRSQPEIIRIIKKQLSP